MRELKFMAWDKDDYIMWDWNTLKHFPFSYLEKQNATLMQYTGLKDKNGKEIYEGFVLRIPDSTTTMEVKWENIVWTDQGTIAGFGKFLFSPDQYEIIGNIYENPELIKND